ncbi:MAG: hypothetical protein ACOCZK_05550, partial [Planctomycetota bacterium]
AVLHGSTLALLILAGSQLLAPRRAAAAEGYDTLQELMQWIHSFNNSKQCENNTKYCCPWCNPDDGRWYAVGKDCPTDAPGLSVVHNLLQNHVHDATDYAVRDPSSQGCGSCSGGTQPDVHDKMHVALKRFHRFREVSFQSSFGPGVFTQYDKHLALTAYNDGTDALKGIEFFDPTAKHVVRFVETDTPGMFHENYYNAYESVVLYSAYDVATGTGTPVGAGYDYRTVSHAVLTRYDGAQAVFEVIRTEADPSPLVERARVPEPRDESLALPSGTIEAFGFYAPGTVGHLRYDNYTLVDHSGTVRYREVFPLNGESPGDNAITEGWRAVRSSNARMHYAQIYGDGVITDPPAQPVNSDPQGTDTSGRLFWGPTGLWEGVFLWTEEYRGMNSDELAAVRFHTRHGSNPAPSYVAIRVSGTWYVADIASTHTEATDVWQAQELLLANAAWRRIDVDTIAENVERGARLVQLRDRRGFATDISYQYADDPDNEVFHGDKLWQVDQVVDRHGAAIGFTYAADQVAGRWVVERADLPNGTSVAYSYADGKLAGVAHADGTASSFVFGFDGDRNLVTLAYDDVAAAPGHRRKTSYLTTAYSIGDPDAPGSDRPSPYYPSAAQLVRAIENGAGEVAYANLSDGLATYVFEGGNTLRKVDGANMPYATAWSVDPGSDGALSVDEIAASWEPTYGGGIYPEAGGAAYRQDKPDTRISETGTEVEQTWGPMPCQLLGEQFADGSSTGLQYNDYNQIAQSTDENGLISTAEYDAHGNPLTRTVGLQADGSGGAPVTTDATATISYAYHAAGDGAGLLATRTDARGKQTDYEYNARGLLTRVRAPANDGGTRPTTEYVYDAADRLGRMLDPAGRATTYAYDDRNRVSTITYHDTSTESLSYYPQGAGTQAGLLQERVDRVGNRTVYTYDAADRKASALTYAPGASAPERRESWTYLSGTDRVASHTVDDVTTSYTYDYRRRRVSTTITTTGDDALTTRQVYDATNQLAFTEDPYGRKTYFVYSETRDWQIRTVRETVPDGVPLDPETGKPILRALPRLDSANAPYVITDTVHDRAGRVVKRIDGRGTVTTIAYDAQGRTTAEVRSAAAVALDATVTTIQDGSTEVAITDPAIARRTEYDYDAAGNVIAIRHPRYFDPADAAGYQQAQTAMSYTDRGQLASRTEAPDTTVEGAESYAYTSDNLRRARTDANGRIWQTVWRNCCQRVLAQLDPVGDDGTYTGRLTLQDYAGRTTYTAVVAGIVDADGDGMVEASENAWRALPAAQKTQEVTTRYDSQGRPIARTRWLEALADPINENAVPIADRPSPAVPGATHAASAGLTTTWSYDDELADGSGIDADYSSYVTAALGAPARGSAVATTNPAGETSVVIRDGSGRTVMHIDPAGDATLTRYDSLVADLPGAPGELLATSTIVDPARSGYSAALALTSHRYSDGRGRVLVSEDAAGDRTTMG